MLDAGQAVALARVIRAAVNTHFPHHVTHLVRDNDDVRLPAVDHPAFHGSYDWHSCVHMHWSAVRLLSQFGDLPEIKEIATTLLDASLTSEKIQRELAYFQTPQRASFERPYGWAWLLKLDAELALCPAPRAKVWRDALAPLADHLANAFEHYLRTLPSPIRHGVHNNTAFACVLALQWAKVRGRWSLHDAVVSVCGEWFANDAAHGIYWEPCATDFLSPTLTEALLMSQILPTAQFVTWYAHFLPISLSETPLASTAIPADRADGQFVHLDGLNLSRAWCARGLISVLPLGSSAAHELMALAERSVDVAREQAISGEFVATHWLASFLLLAETEFQGVL